MPTTSVHLLNKLEAHARKKELEQLLAATRGDPARIAERAALREEDDAVSAHLAKIKEETHRENTRRNFAGIGSPLYEAIVARFDAAVVAELEVDALARFAERERRSADRKAQKKSELVEQPVKPTSPEITVIRATPKTASVRP